MSRCPHWRKASSTDAWATACHVRWPISSSPPCRALPSTASAARTPQRSPARHTKRRGSDRKSTRLNSSHLVISYAVFCLKKKRTQGALHLDGKADGHISDAHRLLGLVRDRHLKYPRNQLLDSIYGEHLRRLEPQILESTR